ncbi:hypothetical protein C497_01330 [Halalkalicoccus jeotgali B3]|uniref:Uncharacterized protein n=1 Tax=Halalkalicoccus jeotgali (strain DSM 18796 / CECT 7217 / JCM 14584 / KCTC 4019 / B3) TaxID=795797 RepID=L9VWH9_HALJB|nr:hypothetical protein C497_01330 [Halalkalicoccus jeotgali B3]
MTFTHVYNTTVKTAQGTLVVTSVELSDSRFGAGIPGLWGGYSIGLSGMRFANRAAFVPIVLACEFVAG